MTRYLALALLLLAGALPARAQFELLFPNGSPAASAYDLGAVSPGEPVSAAFRLRNLSAAPATLSTLGVAGAGFTISAPALPLVISGQSAIDFTVNFLAPDTGAYSAALRAEGLVLLITASVVPGITCRTDGPNGSVFLTTLDFGSVLRGSLAERRVTLRNESAAILTVPPVSVLGDAFSLAATPAGQLLQPKQTAEFTVAFRPLSAAPFNGILRIGTRTFPLSGAATLPPLPKPSLAINPLPAASGRQGSLLILFDTPAPSSGAGTAMLEFHGPPDPAIAFASGTRTAAFFFAAGDTQAALPFQTGTSAGPLSFAAQLGQSTAELSVIIAPAPPTVTAAEFLRSPGALEIRITGFDNTRTLGLLTFTFRDAAGTPLASLPIDASADFAKFFAASDLGGIFLLHALFPVTGDPSPLTSCLVTLQNAAGPTTYLIPLTTPK